MSSLQASLQKLSPSAQRSLAVALGAAVICGLLISVVIMPLYEQMAKSAQEIEGLQRAEKTIRLDIGTMAKVKSDLAATNAALDMLRAAGVIEPLLGSSYAMSAKTLLDPIAAQVGFRIENVRELSALPLQTPKPAPEQTYVRQSVEFSGQGSYEQIAAFIAQAEKAQALAVLAGLSILCQPQTPEVQKAIITFEWPAKGERVKRTPTHAQKSKSKNPTP